MRKMTINIQKGSFGLTLTRKTLGNLSGGSRGMSPLPTSLTITISVACDYARPSRISEITSGSVCKGN